MVVVVVVFCSSCFYYYYCYDSKKLTSPLPQEEELSLSSFAGKKNVFRLHLVKLPLLDVY